MTGGSSWYDVYAKLRQARDGDKLEGRTETTKPETRQAKCGCGRQLTWGTNAKVGGALCCTCGCVYTLDWGEADGQLVPILGLVLGLVDVKTAKRKKEREAYVRAKKGRVIKRKCSCGRRIRWTYTPEANIEDIALECGYCGRLYSLERGERDLMPRIVFGIKPRPVDKLVKEEAGVLVKTGPHMYSKDCHCDNCNKWHKTKSPRRTLDLKLIEAELRENQNPGLRPISLPVSAVLELCDCAGRSGEYWLRGECRLAIDEAMVGKLPWDQVDPSLRIDEQTLRELVSEARDD